MTPAIMTCVLYNKIDCDACGDKRTLDRTNLNEVQQQPSESRKFWQY